MTIMPLHQLSQQDQWFRYWMPYAFEPLAHSTWKHVLLPLNRNYKPLGITSKDHVDYNHYVSQAMVFNFDPAKFDGVWYSKIPHLYLYDDTEASRADYFPRLHKLFSRSVRLVAMADEPK